MMLDVNSPLSTLKLSCDAALVSDGMRDIRLKDALETVQDDFDFALIDCPPQNVI